MKKIFIITLFFISTTLVAQNKYEFLQGFGYDFSFGIPRLSGGAVFTGNGINYVPRFVSPINEDLSIGISLPIGLSLVNSLGSLNSNPIGFNYAISADINFGLNSTKASRNRFGAFFGLGFGSYDLYSFYDDGTGIKSYRDANYGIYSQVGIRMPYRGQDISLVASNWRGMNISNGRTQVFALKLIYEFMN